MNKQQFFLIWNITNLKTAAFEAYKHKVPLAQVQLWLKTKHENPIHNRNLFTNRMVSSRKRNAFTRKTNH